MKQERQDVKRGAAGAEGSEVALPNSGFDSRASHKPPSAPESFKDFDAFRGYYFPNKYAKCIKGEHDWKTARVCMNCKKVEEAKP